MNERPTRVRFQVLAWLTLGAALAYLCRNTVGVAESTIRSEFGLSKEESGWFMGAFFWTYALFQVPGGGLANRHGTRLTLTLFAVGWSFAALMLAGSRVFWMLIAAQSIMGIAQAGLFPAACLSVSHWMPMTRRSLACGFLNGGMQMGAIIAALATGSLLATCGWRWAFVIYGVPGLIWAAGFAALFRNRPGEHPHVNEAERALIGQDEDPVGSATGPMPWFALARWPSFWFLCGQQMCRAAGYIFFVSWFPTFLQETRGISVANSGYLQALVLAGAFFGSFIGGELTDWIWRRTKSFRLSRGGVGAAFLLACAVLILGAWFVKSMALAMTLLAAGSLFAAIAGPCGYCATIDMGGRHVPQVFGIMNMCGNLAAFACPVIVGAWIQRTGNWDLVLLGFAAVYLIGSICWMLVDPAKKLRD